MTGQMCWTQILTLAPTYVLSQDFTRLPGFLVLVLLVLQASSQCNYSTVIARFTPVGAALPTSLDVLLVMILMQ